MTATATGWSASSPRPSRLHASSPRSRLRRGERRAGSPGPAPPPQQHARERQRHASRRERRHLHPPLGIRRQPGASGQRLAEVESGRQPEKPDRRGPDPPKRNPHVPPAAPPGEVPRRVANQRERDRIGHRRHLPGRRPAHTHSARSPPGRNPATAALYRSIPMRCDSATWPPHRASPPRPTTRQESRRGPSFGRAISGGRRP